MSDNETEKKDVPAESETVDETAAVNESVTNSEESTETDTNTRKEKSRRERAPSVKNKRAVPWVTLLFLFFVLALGAGLAFVSYQGQTVVAQQENQINELKQRLASQSAANEKNLEALASRFARENEQLKKQVQSARTQVSDVEQRVSAQGKRLRAMSDTSREDWLLAEAEYLLKLANQRVRIERSSDGAEALLEEADTILRDLDDPDLHPLRRAVAKDLAALRLMSSIDVEGIYLSLYALTEQIQNIPVRLTEEISAPELSKLALEEEKSLSFWQKTVKSFKGFVGSLGNFIQIDHHDERPKALLPVDNLMYLQQNLRLILERTQLALLREQQDIYSQSLAQASEWLSTYYHKSEPRDAFLNELQELKDKKVVQNFPDISTSLELLNEYIKTLHDLEGVKVPNNAGTPARDDN